MVGVTETKEADWKYFNEIIDVIHEVAKDKRLLKEFLIDILTIREIEEISKRWQIVKMLKDKVPHHQIAKKLRTGVETVTRGSREMRNKRGGFQLALERLEKLKILR